MGYWGWRPLILGLFISTWVVGCNMVTDATLPELSPSAYPRVTLTVGRMPTARVSASLTRAAPPSLTLEPHPPTATAVPYVVLPGDTLAAVAQRFAVNLAALSQINGDVTTLTPGQTLWIPAPLPQVEPPTCYQTRPDNLLCLGRVINPRDYAVESLVVEVYLLRADGSVYLSQESAVGQTSIPPNGSATYEASFEANLGDFAAADVTLTGMQIGGSHFVPMKIEAATTETVGGQVFISATIVNPGTQAVEVSRAFVTLADPAGRVIGYRVYNFDRDTILTPAERLPLRVDLTPQVVAADPEYTLYVEAFNTGS